MKTSIKTILLLIMFIVSITLILLPTSVNATYSAKIAIEPSKTEVTPGETIDLVVKMNDIQDAGTGILEMMGEVEYDTNFFDGGITGAAFMQGKDKLFTISSNTPITESGSVFATVQIKVKSNATGSGYIKFTNLVSSTGEEATSSDITLNFTVKNSSNPPSTQPSNPPSSSPSNPPSTQPSTQPSTKPPSGGSGNGGSGSGGTGTTQKPSQSSGGSSTTNKQQTGTSPYALPKAGKAVVAVLIVLFGIASTVSFIFYRRYRKL